MGHVEGTDSWNRLMEQTHGTGTDSWNRLMEQEQIHGTESWNRNRFMEQTHGTDSKLSRAHKFLKKGSWFMNDFNHIIYNDNVKLLLLLLGPDH